MKYLFALLIICLASSALAQKKGYFSFYGGMSFKDQINKPIFGMSMGGLMNNSFGIGLGVGYTDYGNPYIPVTLDISFFGLPKKVSPVFISRLGYGIYDNSLSSSITNKGGFTASVNGGISFPVKETSRIFFCGGFNSYGFTQKIARTVTRTNDQRFSVIVGIKI